MLRQLLLYTRSSVFLNVLSENHYFYFTLLQFIIRILSVSSIEDEKFAFCEEAIKTFVEGCETFYNENIMSYNMQCLLHIVDDVKNLGCIKTYIAIPFENAVREFTKNIRKPGSVLEQYYNRFQE